VTTQFQSNETNALANENKFDSRQQEPVGKVVCLFPCANQLDDRKKLLESIIFFLLFENQHKVVTKARLHHNPVDGAGECDIRS
jgi:hypothetical protein